eukprot:3396725-Rhodomonas_salina.1
MAYKYNRPHKMNWHITEGTILSAAFVCARRPVLTSLALLSGGIKELVGTYDFIQITPERTRVIYNLYVEPGFPFPEVRAPLLCEAPNWPSGFRTRLCRSFAMTCRLPEILAV